MKGRLAGTRETSNGRRQSTWAAISDTISILRVQAKSLDDIADLDFDALGSLESAELAGAINFEILYFTVTRTPKTSSILEEFSPQLKAAIKKIKAGS